MKCQFYERNDGQFAANKLELKVNMSHALVNLTLPVVVQEIEDVLEEYPAPYHLAFSMPELRQKLIAHVLSHVPNRYTVEGVEESTKHLNVRPFSPLAERLKMEMIVRAGILNILRENADYLSRSLPQL